MIVRSYGPQSVPNRYPSTLLFDTYLGRISTFENNNTISRCSEKQHCAHMSHGEATGGPGIEASSVWSHAYPSLPIPPNTLWGSVFGPPGSLLRRYLSVDTPKWQDGYHIGPIFFVYFCLKWHDLKPILQNSLEVFFFTPHVFFWMLSCCIPVDVILIPIRNWTSYRRPHLSSGLVHPGYTTMLYWPRSMCWDCIQVSDFTTKNL